MEAIAGGSTTVRGVDAATQVSWSRKILNQYFRTIYGALGIAILLCSWQLAASLNLLDVTFSSSPVRVLLALINLFATGEIWAPLGTTAAEVAWGLLISLAISIPLGLVLGQVRFLYDMADPIINIFNAVPYVVFFPIIIFWFGLGNFSRDLVVVWSASLTLVISTTAGVRNIRSEYVRVARVSCASQPLYFWAVLLPASMPYILTGVRLAVARALVGAIVAEFFLSGQGLGYLVQRASSELEMDKAFAVIVVMAIGAVALTKMVTLLERRCAHWSQA